MQPGLTMAYPAGANLAARRFVKINSSGQAVYPVALDTDADGVTFDKADSGKNVAIHHEGLVDLEAGEAIAVADLVTFEADTGRAMKAVGGAKVQGKALEEATAAGNFLRVLLRQYSD